MASKMNLISYFCLTFPASWKLNYFTLLPKQASEKHAKEEMAIGAKKREENQ